MDQKMVSKMLEGATKKDYIKIISDMSVYDEEAEQVIIDWCKKNNEKGKKQAVEIELNNLWAGAMEIISEFNLYGGGPEEEDMEAADRLRHMEKLVKSQDISWEVRVAILDEMLEEFYQGNSGFDDMLVDIAVSFCKEKEEKRYLADALANGDSDYYRGYAANLYKSIGDGDKFLETKLNNLHYGSDYVDVAKYYNGRGNRKKALEYIWQGMEKCSGRLDGLISYAATIYIKEENDDELSRMFHFAMKTGWDVNIFAIAEPLYRYSKKKSDYDSEKKMLLLLLESCKKDEIKKWFETCKRELSEEDWEQEYENILGRVRKKNEKFYLDICMDTGKESVVLECLQNERHGYDYWDLDYDGYFSKRLFEKYPDEVLALYWRDVHSLLSEAKNKNYDWAVKLLNKIKPLMKKNGQTEEWKEQFEALKERHKRKTNFMSRLGKL